MTRRTFVQLLAALGVVGLTLSIHGAAMADPDVAGINRLFTELRASLEKKDEAAFEALVHPDGLAVNLVGGSGLSGASFFSQGSRKGWYLEADVDKMTSVQRGNKVWIVPCAVWSIDKKKAVDAVFAAVVYRDARWVWLGAGEKRAEVEALARRFEAGEALAPPTGK